MLDLLIHQIVHMEYFDDTLPILQNFEKTIFVKGLIEFHSLSKFLRIGKMSSKYSDPLPRQMTMKSVSLFESNIPYPWGKVALVTTEITI